MKLPWFNKTPTVAPARSGTGLTSTYAADRAEALDAQRKAAADELAKELSAINAQAEKAKALSAQRVAKLETEAEATRQRVGAEILAEFYDTAEPLVRAHLTEPTRSTALELRDAFLHFSARSQAEIGATQGTEYMGLVFASVLVADAPGAVVAFTEVVGDLYCVSVRCVAEPLKWCDELAALERRMVARATDILARGYAVTDYHRKRFHAAKFALSQGERAVALAEIERAEEARKCAERARAYVPPPNLRTEADRRAYAEDARTTFERSLS